MCGRFSLTQRLEVLERIFKAKARTRITLPRYNVAPTQPIAVICNDEPQLIQEVDWGLSAFSKSGAPPRLLVNAKAETIQERSMYAGLFASRRCLILADGFFEWETRAGKRYPRYFRLRDGQPFAFAGLYDEQNGKRHAVIITTEANTTVAQSHNRMPVMLAQPERWLSAEAPQDLHGLLQPYADELMDSFMVDPVVNSPENDTEACITPFEPPELSLF
ncbi:MAG: SOS response-associated peptidase [Vulcanimicrobiaceae bacterium]